MRLKGKSPNGLPALSYVSTPEGSLVGSTKRPTGTIIAVPGGVGPQGVSGASTISQVTGLQDVLDDKVSKTANEGIGGNKSFTDVVDFSKITYTKELSISPTNGPGTTAAVAINNDNGQVWQLTNNSGGLFAFTDHTNGRNALSIQSNPVDNAIVINSEVNLGTDIDMQSHRITNVTNPTGAQDAATKSYVDTVGAAALQPSSLLRPDDTTPSTLCANPPAITHAASGTDNLTVFGYQTHGTNWTGLGTNLIVTVPGDTTARPLTAVVSEGRVVNDVYGDGTNQSAWEWETLFTGTTLEILWNCSYNDWAKMQIFIDDEPTTAEPFQPTGAFGSTVSPYNYYTRMVFPTAGTRKVRVRWENCAMKELRCDYKGSILATQPTRQKIAFVGTSNLDRDGGSGGFGANRQYTAIDAAPWAVADALGMTCVQAAVSSSGYIAGGGYGATRRLNGLIATAPDFIVVEGANNDNGNSYAAVNTAAAGYYSALAAALPNTPVLVVGPLATDFPNDESSERASTAAAVRAAALAASNVVAYVDPVGWWDAGGATPPNYANSTSYSVGDVVRSHGGTYKCLTGHTSDTSGYPNMAYWQIISWLTGTGSLDHPNNTGSRDLLWMGDNGHTTLLGQRQLALNIVREIAKNQLRPRPAIAAAPWSQPLRDGSGRMKSAAPSAADDVTPKAYVDGLNELSVRKVGTTASGDTSSENGAGTWAKICSWTAGSPFQDCSLVLGLATRDVGGPSEAIVAVHFAENGTGADPTAGVSVMACAGTVFKPDSWKVVTGAYGSTMELWVQKWAEYVAVSFYELSSALDGGTLTYEQSSPWQSAEPTGTVNNVRSNGVTAFGNPVRTVRAFATGARPAVSSLPVGSDIYDTTLHKPIWSDGTNWRDAAGTVV